MHPRAIATHRIKWDTDRAYWPHAAQDVSVAWGSIGRNVTLPKSQVGCLKRNSATSDTTNLKHPTFEKMRAENHRGLSGRNPFSFHRMPIRYRSPYLPNATNSRPSHSNPSSDVFSCLSLEASCKHMLVLICFYGSRMRRVTARSHTVWRILRTFWQTCRPKGKLNMVFQAWAPRKGREGKGPKMMLTS